MGEAIQSMDSTGDNPLQAAGGFLGPVVLFLGFLSFFNSPRRFVLPLGGVTLFGFLLSLGRHTPLHALACSFVPGFSTVQMPFRFIYLSSLGASMLSALGVQVVLDRWGSCRPWRKPSLLTSILSLLALGPLLAVGWSFYITGPPKNFDYPANSVFMRLVPKPPSPGRILLTPSLPYRAWYERQEYFLDFPVDSCATQKIRCATGYNPLQLNDYQRLQNLPLQKFTRLLSANQIVSQNDLGTKDGFLCSKIGPLFSYRLETATQAVKFPGTVFRASDGHQAYERIQDPSFDVEHSAVVVLPDNIPLPPGGSSDGFTVQLQDEDSNHQDFELDAPRDGLAVFPDSMFPGWKARLDGHKTDIYQAQSALRSVLVPKGRHRLSFFYRPFWWPWLVWVLLLWLFGSYKILSTNK